ncbi:MAG TPA: hypothetical protein VGK76_10060 [Candidatus Eisenbacteria bacterium]|jgi:hypothetical protein
MSHRTLLCACSLLVTLVALNLSPTFVSLAAGSTDRELPVGVLRLRGGLVFPDPDGVPGPGWSAGGALGLALSRNVLVSVNYDHLYLDVAGSPQSVDPMTIQLEFGVPYQHRITPRAEVGAGLYSMGSTGYAIPRPLRVFVGEEVRSSRDVPFGMNFGGGASIRLWNRTMFDVDLRYHQTMGSDALIMGTVGAGLSYVLR